MKVYCKVETRIIQTDTIKGNSNRNFAQVTNDFIFVKGDENLTQHPSVLSFNYTRGVARKLFGEGGGEAHRHTVSAPRHHELAQSARKFRPKMPPISL